MLKDNKTQNAVVIGGGFYGAVIAIYLVKQRGFRKVSLIEQEDKLLSRASYNNQARVHNGYHYPRNFLTAFRSKINMPKFINDWSSAITNDFKKLYAISKLNSKINSNRFKNFCNKIGLNIEIAPKSLSDLFQPHLIESVFLVEEYAFNSSKLAAFLEKELNNCGIKIYFKRSAESILKVKNFERESLNVVLKLKDNTKEILNSKYIFNCSYSGINQFKSGDGKFIKVKTEIKHEITEIALIKVPSLFINLGVTIMDGPFCSVKPFPPRSLHTLYHVRYTPHTSWDDKKGLNPYRKLEKYELKSRYNRMIRDAARYIPKIINSTYVDSLFEIKTILL